MKKGAIAVILAIGLALSSSIVLALADIQALTMLPKIAGNTTTSGASIDSTNVTLTAESFFAVGSIASMIFDNQTITAFAGGNAGSNAASLSNSGSATSTGNNTIASVVPEKTFILTGSWHMKVEDGNVTYFTAKFTKVHVDATNRHTHKLANFHTTSSLPAKLNANGTTFISGTIDVGMNGANAWTSVRTTIMIEKLSTIVISLDPTDTDNHFKGQSIYGTVNLLIGKDGRPVLTFPHP